MWNKISHLNEGYIGKVLRYGIVGVIGTVTHFSVLVILVELFNQSALLSSSIGFIVTVLISFVLNSKYTFKQGKDHNHIKFMKYAIVSCTGFLLNYVMMYTFVEILSFHYSIAQGFVVIVLPISNFLLNNYWTFK
jgi:putative flippase GtrA